jgi:hypothetical protein
VTGIQNPFATDDDTQRFDIPMLTTVAKLAYQHGKALVVHHDPVTELPVFQLIHLDQLADTEETK